MSRNHRKERLDELLLQEVNNIVMYELNDPRLDDASVSAVDVTPDLQVARVYVAPLDDEVDMGDVLRGLDAAQGYIRSQIAQRVRMRHVPELVFRVDQSLQYAQRVEEILEALPPIQEWDEESL